LKVTPQRIRSTSRCKLSVPPVFQTKDANDIDYTATWFYIDTKGGPGELAVAAAAFTEFDVVAGDFSARHARKSGDGGIPVADRKALVQQVGHERWQYFPD
jgi:hypothetical protein